MSSFAEPLTDSIYEGYAYSYPHKTAYRHFENSFSLNHVWAKEGREALFLYIHIPFCGMRCGFCNLFTQVGAREDIVSRYLGKLQQQADVVRRSIGELRFVRVAIGGGTPTYLDCQGLELTLDVAETIMGANLLRIPVCIEVSPDTVTDEKLSLLFERGVSRVSIGIQSFIERETQSIGRPQRLPDVERSLAMLRNSRFAVLNIDLIYGLPEQTVESWVYSITRALEYAPQEIYLYPLYVRPLTGLGRTSREWDDWRLNFYRQGRDLLLREGYSQSSMRMFRAKGLPPDEAPPYRCQEDNMIGLGCGARSYTRALHYCTEYAVSSGGVRDIIAKYLDGTDESFKRLDYGIVLTEGEQRRRFVIQSLLSEEGLSLAAYRRRFASEALDDIPMLAQLIGQGLANEREDKLELNEKGVERSDQIGPAFYSENVRRLMKDYVLR